MERRTFLTGLALGSAAAAAAPLRTAYAAAPASATVKPGSGPLWTWTATQLADAIRRGSVSSLEATESCIQRLYAVNHSINAVAEVLEEEALKAAREADRLRARGEKVPPLHGVPVTTKINVDLAGHATTNGVVALKNAIAKEDSASVAALRRHGAVIIGRTNVPAFSFRWFSDNDLHGATLNPWDPALTPGGSSGGAAAAVAAGIGPIAHGNDIAGSVRYPAFACGVAGIRPTLGAAPSFNPSSAGRSRPMAGQLMASEGYLARSVADLRYSFPTLTQRDVRDPRWVESPTHPTPRRRGMKVALLRQLDGYTADAEVAAGLEMAAKALRAAGYEIEEVAPPNFREAAELWSPLVMAESRRSFVPAVEKMGDARLKKSIATWIEVTPDLDLGGYISAMGRRDLILREWRVFLEKYPVLVTPSSWMNPFAVDYDQQAPDTFRKMLQAQSPQLAVALLGLPGLSVPTGIMNGIPTGVQIVADRFREDLCFDAGEAIEAAVGVFTPIDPRSTRAA
jgi:amidase